jgi:ABC-type branched-subunit amino acid transport system substrate-binding protein
MAWTRWISVLGILSLSLGAQAQLLIGQTAGVTGAVAATVNEAIQGARLYIDHINTRGGVAGEKIELITLDDKFEVKQAAENARVLIEEKKVLALFLNRGTPHTEAIMPLLVKNDIALIGPSTGAMVLHQPVKRHIFNVRSSYQREAKRAIEHLATVSITRIAVVHVDDTFGQDALAGTMEGLKATNTQALAILKFDRAKPDYSTLIPELAKLDPQAIVWIGSGTAVTDGIKALRAAGANAQIITLSNNASGGFIKNLGAASRGVIVTQVLPYERGATHAFIMEARELASKQKGLELSPAMLEGYISAKVLVEALRIASPKPTRTKIIDALNGLRKFDVGGLEVSYSPSDHTGLDYVDLSIIGNDGRFKR